MTMTPGQIQKLLAKKPDFANAILDGKVSLKRLGSNPPRYELLWPDVGKDTPISLDGDALWSWATMQKAIFKIWKAVVGDMKPKDWHNLLTILNDNRTDVDMPGASEAAGVLDTLQRWIDQRGTVTWSAIEVDFRPLYRDGFHYFRLHTFETQALFAQGSRYYYQRHQMPRDKLLPILKNAGAVGMVRKFKGGINKWVWQIPEDFNKPAEQPLGGLIPLIPDDGEEGDAPKGEKGEKQGELTPDKEEEITKEPARDAPEWF